MHGRDEKRRAADGAERADGGIHAAGNDGARAVERRFAAGIRESLHVLGSVEGNGSLSTGV